MKLLVLGGKGMAGHVIADYFSKQKNFHVKYTTRDILNHESVYLNATNFYSIKKAIYENQPDVVINAIGLLNEEAEKRKLEAIQVNSLFPHHLVELLNQYNGKLIHISTDCVFSGRVDSESNDCRNQGRYSETDLTDGATVYAKTKALGEIIDNKHVTIRTSIIGPELKDGIGLFHWFMNQKGEIKGYKNVLWNGVTTLQLAKSIHEIIENKMSGLFHLTAPEIISKYDLLKMLQVVFRKDDVTIQQDGEIKLNRTLRQTRPNWTFQVPSYKQMLQELYDWMKQRD
ncbi:dTDP-4-dehydrorhamnose reductase family protein [Bacillus kwashiorkori]|uniref:dTDP-4-dehydrorhamnose reductase family protein n=1 Tax=Bacillus kwashiorkori TaxID=1522318 RepID=UPI0007867DD4|nr:SDR family oxidoreductase [Bacillus kwashiorkori]